MAQAPLTVRIAAGVQAAEAVVVLAASVLAAVDTARGRSYQTGSGIAITVIGIGAAVALGLVAGALYLSRQWTRTPALLTQLFTGIVGIYLAQAHRYAWAVPVLALAVAGLISLLSPPSLRALTRGRPAP
jgi:hypothetical protein